jgi:hypothetical protein
MVQTVIRHGRTLLRETLLPLLCAFIALSGVLEARVLAQRALAGPDNALTLCIAGQQPIGIDEQGDAGQNPAAAHDCATCCLPAPLALTPRLATILPPHAPVDRQAERGNVSFAHAEPHILPWSRGPPGRA